MRTALFRVAILVLSAALAGCGGSDGADPAPTPAAPPSGPSAPPTSNQPPTAAIAAAAQATAGAAIAFDASASSDPEGDAIAFSWDFGDGTRGASAKLAHIFPAPGDYTVTLTVTDSRGAARQSQHAITVAAGPAGGAPVTTTVLARDAAGSPLPGVTVSVAGGATAAVTGANGQATLATPTGVAVALHARKAGYADQTQVMELPASADGGYLEVTLLARETVLTLADAGAGGTLAGKHGAAVAFPANALVDASGAPVSGAVQVAITPVDVGANVRAFPGKFEGVSPTASRGQIMSYGTVEFVLTQNGAPVALAPGRRATIEIPVYTALNMDGSAVKAGDVYPMWSLDERTGIWVQEGFGTVVAAAGSPSGLALRGEVGHFSWWNHDQFFFDPEGPAEPEPRCLVDTDHDGNLEDLTNTGFCWHYGTGPDQPNQDQTAAALARRLNHSATHRLPAYAASAHLPAAGGVALPIPGKLDVLFTSTALNGTLRGSKIVNLPGGVRQPVTIVLYPVGAASQNEPITLPWDRSYSIGRAGELDRFVFTAAAGASFDIRVSQASSTVTGTVRLIDPNGATVGSPVPFDGTAALVSVTAALAGEYKIEVVAGGGTPGAYRLEATPVGGCASTTPLAVPVDHSTTIAARATQCFALALAADDAIEVDVTAFNVGPNLQPLANGTVSFGDDSAAFVTRSFGNKALRLGAAGAGNYVLRVKNTTDNGSGLSVKIRKLAVDVLPVPGSRNWSDVTTANPKLVLVKPPVAGDRVGLVLTANQGQHGVYATPPFSSFLVSCAGCATADTNALSVQPHPALLPVVEVFRNNGAAASSVTLRAVTPAALPLDTDVTGASGSEPLVYAFEGNAGAEVAFRLMSISFGQFVAHQLVGPTGAVVSQGVVQTLPATGPYTMLIKPAATSANFAMRVNQLAPPEALTLTPPHTTRTATLALGEIRRYTLPLAAADLLSVTLDTPGALEATAVLNGVHDAFVSTPPTGTPPLSAASPPRYVKDAGAYTLQVKSDAFDLAEATGAFTVGVFKPDPVAAAVDTPLAASVAPGRFAAFGFSSLAAGRYLLRLTSPAASGASAVVWAPSTIFVNYAGDLQVSSSGGALGEAIGLLVAGHNKVSVVNLGGAATDIAASLVTLEQPVALALGAPVNGTIDAAGERDYASFAGTGGQAYTLRVTPAFDGVLYVRKLPSNGDPTQRSAFATIAGFPTSMSSGVEKVVAFTIPADAIYGNGTYVVEIAAAGAATGAYSARVDTP